MNWREIEGWFTEGEAEYVRTNVADIRDGLIVELGSYCGRSAVVLGEEAKKNGGVVFAIDNFQGGEPEDPATQRQQQGSTLPILEENIRQCGLEQTVKIISGDSAESASLFEDGSVDFCFVDADHRTESVTRDLTAWWPKIKVGGKLGGHDYLAEKVRSAVDRFAGDRGLKVHDCGQCFVMEKRSC